MSDEEKEKTFREGFERGWNRGMKEDNPDWRKARKTIEELQLRASGAFQNAKKNNDEKQRFGWWGYNSGLDAANKFIQLKYHG